MRAIVGALAGLVAATAIVAVVGNALGQQAFLAILIAGLVAGLLMRALASGAGSVYARGALAAAMTAVAAVAGPMAATQWFKAQSDRIAAPPKSVVAQSTDDEEETASGGGAAAAPIEVTPVSEAITGGAGVRPVTKTDTAAFELVSMAIGCLLAYQLGKGKPAATAASEEAAEGDGEAATVPPTDESAEPVAESAGADGDQPA